MANLAVVSLTLNPYCFNKVACKWLKEQKREWCSNQVTHIKREGGLKILFGKDFKAEHIVPGNVYRLEKRKFWLSLACSVATRHVYQKSTKRGQRKAPFWRRAGQLCQWELCFKAPAKRRKLTPSWLCKTLSPTSISKKNKNQSKSEEARAQRVYSHCSF